MWVYKRETISFMSEPLLVKFNRLRKENIKQYENWTLKVNV